MSRFAVLLFALSVYPSAHAQCPKGSQQCVVITKPANGTGPGTETETIGTRPNNRSAASDRVEALTRRELTYIFEILPDIQRAHNDPVNRREGQFTPIYEDLELLTVVDVPLASSLSDDVPRVKSYYLGESWSDFLSASPVLKTKADECSAEKRPDLSKHRKKIFYEPCLPIWRMTDNPPADTTFDCLQGSFGASKDMLCQDINGEVSFVSGRLSALKIIISGDWNDIYPDIIKKFGQPNGIVESGRIVVWNTEKYHVIAAAIQKGAAIFWMNPKTYEQKAANAKELLSLRTLDGNSLDR